MRILFIAYAFPPYAFSESICNGKLVLCLKRAGYEIDVISRKSDGPNYASEWVFPWKELQSHTREISYRHGGKVSQLLDVLASEITFATLPMGGLRWARRALDQALAQHRRTPYDLILTRSPNDVAHLVGREFSKKTGVHWIANWNDPADSIWPEPYAHHYNKAKESLYNVTLCSCFSHAAAHTFPSPELMEHFIAHFPKLKGKLCEVIPHVCLPKDLLRPTPYTKGSVMRICHAGNLSQERDPELLLEALKEYISTKGAAIQLLIMGVKTPSLDSLIQRYELEEHIDFIGALPYIEAQEKLGKFDVLLLLEAKMGHGIFFASKLTDYAQSARPILAVSPSRGYAERILSTYGGGIAVDNTDKKSILTGFDRMYTAWKNGNLLDLYTPCKLYSLYEEGAVTRLYQNLFNRL